MRHPQRLLGAILVSWLVIAVVAVCTYHACFHAPVLRKQKLMKEATKRWKSLESFEKTRWKVEGVDGDYEFGTTATIAYVHSVDNEQKQEEAFGEKHPWPSAGRLVRDDLIKIERRKNLPITSFAPESMGGLPKEELLVGKWIPHSGEKPHTVMIRMTR